MTIDIAPSAPARQLFGQMVARADDDLVLALTPTLKLAVDRKQAGRPLQAEDELDELLAAGWIGAHPSGGWILYEEVMPSRCE